MFGHIITGSTGGTTQLAGLKDELLRDRMVTANAVRAVAATVWRSGHTPAERRLDRLTEAAAWTDAALALLEGALPSWKLRRLTYDEGEWHCALSQRRELPDWLDEAVESHHPNRAVALMLAVIDALQQTVQFGRGDRGAVPRVRPIRDDLFCCENFA
ncbi:MAG: hypothetical protein AB1586_21595 [Pseudomonadota bacterium]|jgi:hypothetical protein